MPRTFCNGACRLSQVVPQLSATVDGAEWDRDGDADAEHEVQRGGAVARVGASLCARVCAGAGVCVWVWGGGGGVG